MFRTRNGKLAVVGILVLCLVGTLFITWGCGEKKEDTIKIGAVLPLTGALASYGENASRGIRLCAKEWNSSLGNGGKRIAVYIEDSKGNQNEAITAYRKLTKSDRVVAIIGDVASSPTLAIAPLANADSIPIVSPAASSPDITDAGPFIYRVWPSDVCEASRMAQYVLDMDYSRISVLYVNNDYGASMYEDFVDLLSHSDCDVVASQTFDQDTRDVRSQLTTIRNSSPDAMYVIAYPKETVVILRQAKELNFKCSLLATSAIEDDQILPEVGHLFSKGVVFTSPIPPDSLDSVVMKFRTEYEREYHVPPGLVSDYGYDAMLSILMAIKTNDQASSTQIANGLENLGEIHGATGVFNFDTNGDVIRPSKMKKMIDGQFVWLGVNQ